MLTMMLLAHLLGDYLFQFDFIARWKARSLWGVIAHGSIVTLTSLACAALVDLSWWPYAIIIGLMHTVVDIVRARLIRVIDPAQELFWFLLDQLTHLLIIVVVVGWGGAPAISELKGHAWVFTNGKLLAFVIGYLLLLQPAWVLLRLVVRGVWGVNAALPLGQGEKFAPMFERILIASLVLGGQYAVIPLVLLPRRITSFQIQENNVGVLVRLTTHWAETLLSVVLAIVIGMILRMLVG